ncbi:hypothetical protein CLOM_g21659 [Closterium sp. NIES-68]|nr:hypothetical protein CLOM_g21659 [Closterium sp. NIES-68]GJP58799.1 hypothetical protein CLOP_g3597 [Closterium sp. NIES-67]
MAAASPSCARAAFDSPPRSSRLSTRRSPPPGSAAAAAAFSSRFAASPHLLVLLLLLSLAVSQTHGRAPASGVADVADSQSEVGASQGRQHDPPASNGGEAAVGATGAGSDHDGAESAIEEWLRRSAEAGAQFFPLQRAEDAPSREELHRRILAPSDIGGGMKGKGGPQKASNDSAFVPMLEYDSTLLSTANGSLGNAFVNYSTFGDNTKIRLPVYPYYVDLKLGSQRQQFSLALNLYLPYTWVPCDCLHCGTARRGTPGSKPFSTLSSTSAAFISCADNSCITGSDYGFFGCNVEGLPNYVNTTGLLPGDDALCVYRAFASTVDYYEADYDAKSYLFSVGHVVRDTLYLAAPDGSEVNRTITFGCGSNQLGYWGMQGWQYGSWAAGGVLGMGFGASFVEELSAGTGGSFAVCLDKPTPTNKPAWNEKKLLQKGSSHLTIGAVGLPAGAQYSNISDPAGMQYSHITLTTAARSVNITDDPLQIDDPKLFMPEDATAPAGFYFMPESFVHLLRLPLFKSLRDALEAMTGQTFLLDSNSTTLIIYRLLCFENKNKSVDPFATFPTIDIAFFSPNNASGLSHFYLKPPEYLAKVSASRYCVLATPTYPYQFYTNAIGEPGLFNKYLFFDYANSTAGWLDSPQCGATPKMPPPSPPPLSPVSKAASTSRSLAAVIIVIARFTALLALTITLL